MLDLQAPLFTQAAVLEVLPELPAKTLQNWLYRNIITLEAHNPGRQSKRMYTASGIIVLCVMQMMSENKIGPSDAKEMGFVVANRAIEIISSGTILFDGDGVPFLPYPPDNYGLCKRHTIMTHEGKSFLREVGTDIDSENWKRTVQEKVYTVVETDFIAIDAINAVLRWAHNNPTKVASAPSHSRTGETL